MFAIVMEKKHSRVGKSIARARSCREKFPMQEFNEVDIMIILGSFGKLREVQ